MTLTALLFPFASWHFDPPVPQNYNQFNPGIVAEVQYGSSSYLVGVLRNSHRATSGLVLLRQPLVGRVALAGGVCSGYRAPICGAVVLDLDSFVVMYSPRIGNYNAHTLAIGWRHAL